MRMNLPKREELLLRTVFALPETQRESVMKQLAESLQHGVGAYDLILESDLQRESIVD